MSRARTIRASEAALPYGGDHPMPPFNPRLESIRGLASFAVVFAHSSSVLWIDGTNSYALRPFFEQSWTAKFYFVAGAFLNANIAVVLFFVLSGYVLTLSLQSRKQRSFTARDYTGFAIRRIMRLMPAMWVSLVFAYAVRQSVGTAVPPPAFTAWFGYYMRPADLSELMSNISLLRFSLTGVTWSMYVEIIGSIAIPVFVLMNARLTAAAKLAALGLLVTAALVFHESITVRHLFCFYLGALIAGQTMSVSPTMWRVLLVAALLLMAGQRFFLIAWPRSSLILAAVVSACLIGYLVAPRETVVTRMLEGRYLRWLGSISYSLYLFHMPVLAVVGLGVAAIGVAGPLANVLVSVAGIALSLLIATLGHRFVESPSIRVGRALERSLHRWPGRP